MSIIYTNTFKIFFPKTLIQSKCFEYIKKESIILYHPLELSNITNQTEPFMLFIDNHAINIQEIKTLTQAYLVFLTNKKEIQLMNEYIPLATIISLHLPKKNLAEALKQCFQNFQQLLKSHAKTRTHFFIQKSKKTLLIPIEDIYYFLAESKYIAIRHKKGHELILHSLNKLEKELGDNFLRIHRNALVSMHYISEINMKPSNTHIIQFKDIADELSISRRKIKEVRNVLKNL